MSTYRPQGEGRPVRVLRRPYTPRDRLLGDRRNIELRLRAEIPKNSYLFVWRGEHKELDLRPVLRFVKDSLDRGQIPGNLEQRIADASKAIGTSKVKEPPTVRDKPYIPSSSIKGAVRSRLEYKFSPKKIKDEFISESCYIVQDGEVGKRHRGFWGDECIQKRQGPCTLQEGGENVCIVCDM
ncbi:MAG: RAMP superfamily CRISPR-associated protein, partial [Candidatus Caldarchaeum sp.]